MGYSRDTPGTSPKNSILKLVSVVELIKVKVTVDTFVAYFIYIYTYIYIYIYIYIRYVTKVSIGNSTLINSTTDTSFRMLFFGDVPGVSLVYPIKGQEHPRFSCLHFSKITEH